MKILLNIFYNLLITRKLKRYFFPLGGKLSWLRYRLNNPDYKIFKSLND